MDSAPFSVVSMAYDLSIEIPLDLCNHIVFLFLDIVVTFNGLHFAVLFETIMIRIKLELTYWFYIIMTCVSNSNIQFHSVLLSLMYIYRRKTECGSGVDTSFIPKAIV